MRRTEVSGEAEKSGRRRRRKKNHRTERKKWRSERKKNKGTNTKGDQRRRMEGRRRWNRGRRGGGEESELLAPQAVETVPPANASCCFQHCANRGSEVAL